MLLEVVVEDDVNCPRCEKVLPILKKICDELNVPLTVKMLNTRAVAVHEESPAARTFSREWVERWGLPEHRRALRKIGPVLDYLQRIRAQPFPVIRVRWFDGSRMREIVVRGFDDSDQGKVRQFIANMYVLLKTLKDVLWGRRYE